MSLVLVLCLAVCLALNFFRSLFSYLQYISGSQPWMHIKITRKVKKKKNQKPMPEPHDSPDVSRPLGVGPGNFFNTVSIENPWIRTLLTAHFSPKML